MHAPAYFESIRLKAANRWNQLEGDPDLAGPWHQLFKQVQSPRHIVSELLQNADDAGATEAAVRIENGVFYFSHNGEDFSGDHFASICRFGYSNKRALHTIGFRGIGFKSTFSLGDVVELHTPTLSVAFEKHRFTEPRWIEPRENESQRTIVCVQIADKYRHREVEKNLEEWLRSPVSLLFFRTIRHLSISGNDVSWQSLGPGPVADTELMALQEMPDKRYLVVRSLPEDFPPEALNEIRQERMVGPDSDIDFPPCRVELVAGATGHLYVVLPTGVETDLPFACNAPFIQDPARLKIKDPETSPTNRWLLERAGKLAAETMLKWLGDGNLSPDDRSPAYDLFPRVDRSTSTLQSNCGSIVEESFEEAITGKSYLLTTLGTLEAREQAVILPEALATVWPAEIASELLDGSKRKVFSTAVSISNRQKLVKQAVVGVVERAQVFSALRSKRPPRPKTWRGLLKLWAYLAPDFVGYRLRILGADTRLLPVEGKEDLYAASEVVRLGEKKSLQSQEDWDFIDAYLIVLNQNWRRYLSDQSRDANLTNDSALISELDSAHAMLRALSLEEPSNTNEVIDNLAGQYFGQNQVTVDYAKRLAQIACKLGATIGEKFRYFDQSGQLRTATSMLLHDESGALADYFPPWWRSQHMLHRRYFEDFQSCTRQEWMSWVASGRSGLHTFVPLESLTQPYKEKWEFQVELAKRGILGKPEYAYKSTIFRIEDWDFITQHWDHWVVLSRTDSTIWTKIMERILVQPDAFWSSATNARAFHVATTGKRKAVTSDPLLPSWILKLRDLACLPDTRNIPSLPRDLLRRTPTTEMLLDVEPFIHGRLDTEAVRPLLKLLGVRDMPTGPAHLLDRLRTLSKVEKPPVLEVEKWYRRLDQMLDSCSTDDMTSVRSAFLNEKLVLTESGEWKNAAGVFCTADEEGVPGMAVVRATMKDLMLWQRVGIADRATADLALEWLKSLPEDKPLSSIDATRVRTLQSRHALRIWYECGHWLSLAGKWVKSSTLNYAVTMQSLVPWSHLHERVKQSTADLRIPIEFSEAAPFSDLPRLAAVIEERLQNSNLRENEFAPMPWLNRFGEELTRVELESEQETIRVRALARSLACAQVCFIPALETMPYIGGIPAGTAKRSDVVWRDESIFVDDLPKAKLAKVIPDKLGKYFEKADFSAALSYCFDRSAEEVAAYIVGNFVLAPKLASNTYLETADNGSLPTSEITEEGNAAARSKLDAGVEIETTVESNNSADESVTGISQDERNANEEIVDDVVQPNIERPRKQNPKPPMPTLMERFAGKHGFQKNVEGVFFRQGERIEKTADASFSWKRTMTSNNNVHYFRPMSHCLESGPLQLDADIWSLIEKFPDKYSLVLMDVEANPVEVTGIALRAMREKGSLTLFPATYRLVLTNVIPD